MSSPVTARNEEPIKTAVEPVVNLKGSSLRPTKKAKLYKRLNNPLSVTILGGLIILFISTNVQDRYWFTQQRFLLEQNARLHKIEATSLAEEEVIRAVGKRLTGAAILVGAHEGRFEEDQHRRALAAYNLAKDEWDSAEEVLKLKLNIYYPNDKLHGEWTSLIAKLDALDESVIKMDEFDPIDTSKDHLAAVASARAAIQGIENDLGGFSHEMTDFIAKQ